MTSKSCAHEVCRADCSKCRTFPAPYRRISDAPHCLFSNHKIAAQKRMKFTGDRMVRLVFILSGEVRVEDGAGSEKIIKAQNYACLARGMNYMVEAETDSQIVLLSLMHRIEFCEEDIYANEIPHDSVVPMDSIPMLPMGTSIQRLLQGLFDIPELADCTRYHRNKTAELFMMLKVLYTSAEHAYFFQSMMQPQENFCVFVCNNYDKAASVADLAELAGMSLSVFKRRFAEHFNDSVYHWMMRQKALKVFSDIRDGEDNTKVLMDKYDFKYYTQFSRFCKNYLHATPAQLISSIKE